MTIRLATLARDSWELRSAEASQREHPDTFRIPPPAVRANLRRGQAAKLIFDLEAVEEDGSIVVQGERMWVIVAERAGETYVGLLDSQPASIEPSPTVYLCFGAEIPFLPEHVVDIAQPPEEYVTWQLGQVPERTWPRDGS